MAQTNTAFSALTGGCICKTVSYALVAPPLVTHCCHCTLCQRESGSAFKINTVIESYNIKITSSTVPVEISFPSPNSGTDAMPRIAQCPKCCMVLYANYHVNSSITYVMTTTLDETIRKLILPDVHVYTTSKMEWLDLKSEEERGAKIFGEGYKKEEVWSEESLKRRKILQEWDEKNKQLKTGQQISMS